MSKPPKTAVMHGIILFLIACVYSLGCVITLPVDISRLNFPAYIFGSAIGLAFLPLIVAVLFRRATAAYLLLAVLVFLHYFHNFQGAVVAPSSLLHGGGQSVGGSIAGISDAGHALDATFGTLGRQKGDLLPSYYSAEDVRLLQKLFPEAMGIGPDPVYRTGQGVKDSTAYPE